MTDRFDPSLLRVHLLMATYQGERHLEEQLESIREQTHPNWVLHVSDDASTDASLKKIASFVARHQLGARVWVHQGPKMGSTQNFFHLVGLMKSVMQQESQEVLFAFADQDDVWCRDKLERAVKFHWTARQKSPEALTRPLLYATTTWITDEKLRTLGTSRLPQKPLRFSGALVQNALSGNTMVFNAALLGILQKINPEHSVWHDWSAFQVASGCGGVVHLDLTPSLQYRQHAHNVIGEPWGLGFQSLRALKVMRGRYRAWTEAHLLGMRDIWEDLDESARVFCARLERIHAEPSFSRRWILGLQSGLERQARLSQWAFWLACAWGWV